MVFFHVSHFQPRLKTKAGRFRTFGYANGATTSTNRHPLPPEGDNHNDSFQHGGGSNISLKDIDSITQSSSFDSTSNSGFYLNMAQNVFPCHVVVNQRLEIVSAGDQLAQHLNLSCQEDLMGCSLEDTLTLLKQAEDAQPNQQEDWTSWEWLSSRQGEAHSFVLVHASYTSKRFRATVLYVAQQAMINLVPLQQGKREDDITTAPLTTTAVANLRMQLKKEEALVESLVPKHVAQSLRLGREVKPRLHEDVTFFFSDIVGFTDMCKQLYPWQVVGMLNRLYCVMDHLAKKFGLFKVETIGDAYVCASGLPVEDANHAANVANFAIAVNHVVSNIIVSPVDGTPIQLRIGIHTGTAASGVVGVTSPRYCVFGDTVNTTARHESTGQAGRVHSSAVTKRTLDKMGIAKTQYRFIDRGMVTMKGKGELRTYWLMPSEQNTLVNSMGLLAIQEETLDVLAQTKLTSDLEEQNHQEIKRVMGKLGSGHLADKKKDGLFGPVLDIIRQELNNKSVANAASSGSVASVSLNASISSGISYGSQSSLEEDIARALCGASDEDDEEDEDDVYSDTYYNDSSTGISLGASIVMELGLHLQASPRKLHSTS